MTRAEIAEHRAACRRRRLHKQSLIVMPIATVEALLDAAGRLLDGRVNDETPVPTDG